MLLRNPRSLSYHRLLEFPPSRHHERGPYRNVVPAAPFTLVLT